MSALIIRASISSVTPGSVAMRVPASLAAFRADHRQCRVGTGVMSLGAHALPEILGRGVGDDEDLLAVGDAEAVAHHRRHRPIEIAHARHPRGRRSRPSP
jgi:hypothetical protein